MEHEHCQTCYKPNECKHANTCNLIQCPNNCNGKLKFHGCKLEEHLNEFCEQRLRYCLNYTNGCRLKIKANKFDKHLLTCPANITECVSIRSRHVTDQKPENKWKDPIQVQKEKFTNYPKYDHNEEYLHDMLVNIDYKELLKQFNENTFKSNWLYRHLVVDSNDGSNLKLITSVKIPIKSRIFDHIQIDSCILHESLFDLYKTDCVFKDFLQKTPLYTGCNKCNFVLDDLENKLFAKLTSNIKFSNILKHIYDYNEFKHTLTYKNEEFLRIFKENFKFDSVIEHDSDEDSIQKRLDADNELIKSRINLSKTFKVQLYDEPYYGKLNHNDSTILRHKKSNYEHYCCTLLKRNEYSQHIYMFHNLIENNFFDNKLDHACPYSIYGCNYFYRKVRFYFDSFKNMNASLICIDNKDLTFKHSYIESHDDDQNGTDYFSLLPVEVLDVLLSNLDSYSLYRLSQTSKYLRVICKNKLQELGIVYPKWTKHLSIENEKLEINWTCEYYWSFGKYVDPPKHVEFNLPNTEFYAHVQNCPYKDLNVKYDKFKVMHLN